MARYTAELLESQLNSGTFESSLRDIFVDVERADVSNNMPQETLLSVMQRKRLVLHPMPRITYFRAEMALLMELPGKTSPMLRMLAITWRKLHSTQLAIGLALVSLHFQYFLIPLS
jgi:hypothetical protein